jgi:uncharacterized protein (DUF1015 family)
VPHLSAFRALRYDPRAVSDAGAVVCPPYDVISPAERERLAKRHPQNAVHVELPEVASGFQDGTGAAGDRYAVAGRLFEEWQREGILRRDERPHIYPYEQRYHSSGSERVVRGFFCRLRLEDFGPDSGVRPHERTMGGPKEDRYRLLSAVRANLSPVLMLYEAAGGASSAQLLDELTSGPADTEAEDDAGRVHRLWLADPTESDAARALLELAGQRPLTIADGHHRYETALRFRDEQRASGGAGGGNDEPHEFVLSLLYDADSGGLEVLPTHRLLRSLPRSGEALLESAESLFGLTPTDDFPALLRETARGGRLGLWTRGGGAVLAVDRERLGRDVPAGVSEALRWLEVNILDVALRRLVGAPAAELVAGGQLSYTKDPDEALQQVAGGRVDAAFLLPSTPISTVLEIAAAGEVMPQKSTYFEPKAATGLLFNPVVE